MKIVGWTIQNNGQLRGVFATPEQAAELLGYTLSEMTGPCSIAPILEAPERRRPRWDQGIEKYTKDGEWSA